MHRSFSWLAVGVMSVMVTASCSSGTSGSGSVTGSHSSAAPASSSTPASASAAASRSSSPVAIAPLPSAPMAGADAAVIDASVTTLLKEAKGGVPAMIVGIWDPQRGVFVKAFGDADTATKRAATPDDAVRIGSVTKTFIATLILQQVAAGTIDLDAPASQYVPELSAKYPAIGDVTVRHLLAMQSGLPDFENAVLGRMGSEPAATEKAWTADDVIATAFAAGNAPTSPATPAVYTNTNYTVLGEILEAVTGTSLHDLVSEKLLVPLGLKHTQYPEIADTTLPDPHTNGYVGKADVGVFATDGGKVAPGTDTTDWTASWGGAAGIMSSTITDLATWAQADFGSALLPEDLQKQRMETAQLDQGGKYGLGIMTFGPWVGHLGGIPGWGTFAMKNQDTGTIVVLAANSCCGLAQRAELGLVEQFYPGLMANIAPS